MKIHGKEYAEVKDRIPLFWAAHPNGSILTNVIDMDKEYCTIKAELFRDENGGRPLASGIAHEFRGDTKSMVNATSFVENCETSAIGRALANAGFTASDQRPSAEEMGKQDRTKGMLHKRIEGLCQTLNKDPEEVYTKSKAAWKKTQLSIEDYEKIINGLEQQKKGQK